MTELFYAVLKASFQGSIVILAVMLLRLVLKKAPRRVFCLLWLLAGVRLVLPFEIESNLSLQPRLDEQELSVQVEQPVQIPDVLIQNPEGQPMDAPSDPVQTPDLPGNYENVQSDSFLYKVEDGVITGPVTFGDVAARLWLFGVAVMALASVWSYWKLKRRVREAYLIENGCFECPGLETAFVLGFFSPKIYLPNGLAEQETRFIYEHENTHIARGDHWCKLLGYLVLSLHWFNPLVWLGYSLLCRDIELACDEHVVRNMSLPERKAYSAALLSCGGRTARFAACPVAFGESNPKQRIMNVLNYKRPTFWISLLAVIAVAFVAVCLLTSPSDGVGQDKQKGADSEEWESDCLEVLGDVQSRNSVHILEIYDFSGEGLPENQVTWNYFRYGNTWLDIRNTESGYLGWLSTGGKLYESEAEELQFVWQEINAEEGMFSQPWLLTFDLSTSDAEVISRQETDDGYTLRLMVREPIDIGWLQGQEYYVDFCFDHEDNFLRTVLHVTEDFSEMTVSMGLVDLTDAEVLGTIQQYAGATMNGSLTDEEYVEKCRAALEDYQAHGIWAIGVENSFSGDAVLNDSSSHLWYIDGQNWLKRGVVSNADFTHEDWVLMMDGEACTHEISVLHNPANGDGFDTGWVEADSEVYGDWPMPWPLDFDWDSESITFVEARTNDEGDMVRFCVAGSPLPTDGERVEEYLVTLWLSPDGGLRQVQLEYTRTELTGDKTRVQTTINPYAGASADVKNMLYGCHEEAMQHIHDSYGIACTVEGCTNPDHHHDDHHDDDHH